MSFPKKKVRRGLAGLLWMQIEALNYIDEFKKEFSDTTVNILLNPKDQRYAALLKIDKGKIDAEAVKNDKETLKSLKPDGIFEAPMEIFLGVFGEGLSTGTLMKNWITRKIKLRGLGKMMALGKVFELLG